jgi:imidazolonepropionase-like amidohydrolase
MRSSRSIAVFGALLITLVWAPIRLQAQAASRLSADVRQFVSVDAPIFALTNARVVDGLGTPAREGQTIVVDNGRIVQVGATAQVRPPADARIIDLAGKTVIPGIVGLHNHTDYAGVAKRLALTRSAPLMYLGSGVTTIRTAGSLAPYAEINLRRDIEAGLVPGPTVYFMGPRLSEGESNYSPPNPEAARRVVRYWKEEGATWIKAHANISRENLGAAIDEAHRQGIKFTGHLCSVTYSDAADLGIDDLEHGLLVSSDFVKDKEADRCPRNQMESLADVDVAGPQMQALIRKLVDRNVAVTSTLPVAEQVFPGRPVEDRVLQAMSPDMRAAYLERVKRRDEGGVTPESKAIWGNLLKFEKAFYDAGGLLAAGLDPTGNGGAIPGFGDQRNLELLVEAGFTPVQAIQIMTSNGAKVLGAGNNVGSIVAGKRADLVVIDGNPVANPAEIRKVSIVFKDGVGYDSAKLIEAARGLVGLR